MDRGRLVVCREPTANLETVVEGTIKGSNDFRWPHYLFGNENLSPQVSDWSISRVGGNEHSQPLGKLSWSAIVIIEMRMHLEGLMRYQLFNVVSLSTCLSFDQDGIHGSRH
jgi:hypothetical protein